MKRRKGREEGKRGWWRRKRGRVRKRIKRQIK